MKLLTRRPLALLLLLLLCACQQERSEKSTSIPYEESEIPQVGGTAVLAEAVDLSLPLPVLVEGGLDGALQDILYMSLLRGAWRDGELQQLSAEESPMALARRYEYPEEDSTAIRFHLRRDVRWSDGRPLTAHDVAFTYRLLADSSLDSPRQEYTKRLRSVKAEDDSTVTFRFTRRYPEMLFHTGHGIIPRHLYEDTPPGALRTHPTLRNPAEGRLVVSGAFLISRWDRGQQLVLVPNPHFAPKPHLERLVIRIIPDATTRRVEMEMGNLDLLSGLDLDQVAGLLADNPALRLEREEKRAYEFIAYNPAAHPAFRDPEIRRALGQALDVPALLEGLRLKEYAAPAGGPYAPIFRRYYDARTQAPLSHSLQTAQEVLERKGWRDQDGDGIREKSGRPLRFTLVTNTGNPRRADVSQVVQQQWKKIGVEATLLQLEFGTLRQKLAEGEYEAALQGWAVALSPDLSDLWSADAPFNFTRYQNPELTRLFAEAQAKSREEEAAPLWRQAAGILARDQPYTWLYYLDQVHVASNRLRGPRIDTYGRYQNTWEWWVRAEQAHLSPVHDRRAGRAALR